jgi:hypothetical protein
MNTLVAVHGLVLYLAVAWKAVNLSRAPHSRSLRWVTACLVCAALAYPAGIIVAARPTSPAAPWLTFIELACLLGTGYALCCFFVFLPAAAPCRAGAGAAPRDSSRRRDCHPGGHRGADLGGPGDV